MPRLNRWMTIFKDLRQKKKELIRSFSTFKEWHVLLTGYLGFRITYPREFHLRRFPEQSLQVWSQTDVITLWVVFCRQEYDVHHEDKLIIDVGANIGIFAVYAALKAPGAVI